MNKKNTFRGFGPREAEFIARLTYEKKTIVSVEEIGRFLPAGYKYRNQFIYNLKRKNILVPLKRGFYVFSPVENIRSGVRVNELLIPSLFFPRGNYYIGYSTMFNYYGFTGQIFQTIYVLNTSAAKERNVCGISYKFIKISENRMYGLETIKVQDSDVPVSSRERTLVDLIYFNKPVGGIVPAVEILKQTVREKKCSVKELIECSARFPNVTVRKRIGVVLESLGVSKDSLRPLIRSVENTAISSLTGSRRGTLNRLWRAIIDDTQK